MSGDDATSQLRQRQALSALVDGDGEHLEQACRAWREDAVARADWHAYHLIGELMRSEYLRFAPQRRCLRARRSGDHRTHDAPVYRVANFERRRCGLAPLVLAIEKDSLSVLLMKVKACFA